MSGVLVTIDLPGEPRQQFTDPLAAVRCLLRALPPEQIHELKMSGIRRIEQSRLVPPLNTNGDVGAAAIHSSREATS